MIKVLASIAISLAQIAGLIAAIKGDTALVIWCVSNQICCICAYYAETRMLTKI